MLKTLTPYSERQLWQYNFHYCEVLYNTSPAHFTQLREQLQTLEAEERSLMAHIHSQENDLKRQIAARQESLQKLRGNLSSCSASTDQQPSLPSIDFQAVTSSHLPILLSGNPSNQQIRMPIGLSSLIGADSADKLRTTFVWS